MNAYNDVNIYNRPFTVRDAITAFIMTTGVREGEHHNFKIVDAKGCTVSFFKLGYYMTLDYLDDEILDSEIEHTWYLYDREEYNRSKRLSITIINVVRLKREIKYVDYWYPYHNLPSSDD